ncbi:hypothetical protein BKA82DRAFT_145307, partial [Pisolithus tinctorius]
QTLNDGHKIKHMLMSLEDHKSLVMAPLQADIPWLHQMLSSALKDGASICSILCKIEDALEHGYRPCNHSDEAYNLALLIYHLGGGNLLYALSHQLALPSLWTL